MVNEKGAESRHYEIVSLSISVLKISEPNQKINTAHVTKANSCFLRFYTHYKSNQDLVKTIEKKTTNYPKLLENVYVKLHDRFSFSNIQMF